MGMMALSPSSRWSAEAIFLAAGGEKAPQPQDLVAPQPQDQVAPPAKKRKRDHIGSCFRVSLVDSDMPLAEAC